MFAQYRNVIIVYNITLDFIEQVIMLVSVNKKVTKYETINDTK